MRAALIISLLMLAACGDGVPRLQPPGTCEIVESHLEAIIAEVDSVLIYKEV